MSNEEMRVAVDAIRRDLDQITNVRQADHVRITRLEETVTTLARVSANLVTLAQSHDERLDRLVETIDRYITARGNNGSGGQ